MNFGKTYWKIEIKILVSTGRTFSKELQRRVLEPSRTFTMELFCGNNSRLKASNYFHKKAPSQMFNWILQTPLSSYQLFRKISRKTLAVDFVKVFKRTVFQNAFDWILLKIQLQNASSSFAGVKYYGMGCKGTWKIVLRPSFSIFMCNKWSMAV